MPLLLFLKDGFHNGMPTRRSTTTSKSQRALLSRSNSPSAAVCPRKARRLQNIVEQTGHSGISSSVFSMAGTHTNSLADGKLLRTLHRPVLHLKQHHKEWTTHMVNQVSNRIWTLSQTKMGASLSDIVMGHSSHTRATEV